MINRIFTFCEATYYWELSDCPVKGAEYSVFVDGEPILKRIRRILLSKILNPTLFIILKSLPRRKKRKLFLFQRNSAQRRCPIL